MATRTIANGGGNWSATGTWVEAAVPTNADDVVATATSGQVTVDTTTCVCKTLILTNYVNTMTFTAGMILSVAGNVTFVSGMTLAGTGTLNISSVSTLTMGGLTFPGNFIPGYNGTLTLGGTLVIAGNLTMALNVGFAGAYNITCANLNLTSGTNKTYTFAAGRTLTVTTSITIGTISGTTKSNQTLVSGTASSPTYLVYQGTQANSYIIGAIFTDIDASGGLTLYNYHGGTLTRTVNIFNVVLPPQDIFGIVG